MSLTGISGSFRQLLGHIQRCGAAVATNHTARGLSQAASQPEPRANENEAVNPKFVNRNPQNLRLMKLAMKERGWKTTWPPREFHHKLKFSRSEHYVTAEVFSSGSSVPVLTCSTKEWALKQHLVSTRCVAACQAVGEVLAIRCQQAGITRMVYKEIPWVYRSDSVQAFRAALVEGGIVLNEPRRDYVGT